jgi:hypothetical protein
MRALEDSSKCSSTSRLRWPRALRQEGSRPSFRAARSRVALRPQAPASPQVPVVSDGSRRRNRPAPDRPGFGMTVPRFLPAPIPGPSRAEPKTALRMASNVPEFTGDRAEVLDSSTARLSHKYRAGADGDLARRKADPFHPQLKDELRPPHAAPARTSPQPGLGRWSSVGGAGTMDGVTCFLDRCRRGA